MFILCNANSADQLVSRRLASHSILPRFSPDLTVTDSERFYSSVLQLLEEPDEQEEAQGLLMWWNGYCVYFQ